MKCSECFKEKELNVCSECFRGMMFKYLHTSMEGDTVSQLRDEFWKIQDSIKELKGEVIELKTALKLNKIKVVKKK